MLEKILKLYPEYTNVLGPYTRKDGRKHVILNNAKLPRNSKGKTKTISYPKAIKEVELGRRLYKEETIDHLDRDFTNDKLSNLVIRTRAEHASIDAKRIKVGDCICPQCDVKFQPTRYQRAKREAHKAGPFCSKSCSGYYGKEIQEGGQRKPRNEIKETHYFSKK